MNLRRILAQGIVLSIIMIQICCARNADPFPIAFLRQGDVYLIENSNSIKQLTFSSDVMEICWLMQDTLCFSRRFNTSISDSTAWAGLATIFDLFTLPRTGGSPEQFTGHHFARGPSAGNMPGRALFWKDNAPFRVGSEIWETIKPLRRDRPLGIFAVSPDASPDQRWIAGEAQHSDWQGIGFYRYPSADRYRKIEGKNLRPRFSPDGRLLAYINKDAEKSEIWGLEIPDGAPRRLLGLGEKVNDILDFGWAKDGSGYILVLEDMEGKSDIYYWEIEKSLLRRMTEFGDVTAATAWH